MLLFPVKLEKPKMRPILETFCPKNPKTIFSKYLLLNFNLYVAATLCKTEKSNALICYKTHFLSKNLSKFFPQKSHLGQILSSYGAVTSLKKSEKFHILIFHKTWKTSFWTLLAQKPCNVRRLFHRTFTTWVQ